MASWRSGSQKLYDRFGSKLQPLYNKIDALEWTPKTKKVIQSLNDLLPEVVVKYLWSTVININKKSGKDQAEKWLKDIVAKVASIKF